MYQTLRNLLIACAILSLAACGGIEKELELKNSEWQGQLSELKATQDALNAKRAEMAKMQEPPAEGEEAPDPAELKEKTTAMDKEIEGDANNFKNSVADLIYDVEVWHSEKKKGNPDLAMPEAHKTASAMMSDEDILTSEQFIYRQGDYRTAIRILKEALELDAENTKLQDALAKAEREQYMTEDRLSQVEKGMTENQVRKLIGICNTNYIQRYPEKDAMGWFYPREDGGTAGVYFSKKDGVNTVYKVDYNAVESKTEPVEE